MKNIAIIPARGGSKRIPRKNIKAFCGKPMIAWPILAALDSQCFERVVVSTDDPEIAEVARAFGAETPFVRPPELADDHTGTHAVTVHAIDWLERRDGPAEHICCIYATAPFIRPEDLRQGLATLQAGKRDYAFTVTRFDYPIQRALRILPSGGIAMFQPEHLMSRSQDLEPAYHDAGQFYWGRREAWLGNGGAFGENSAPIVLPGYRVQDIDTAEDWERAELLFRMLAADAGRTA